MYGSPSIPASPWISLYGSGRGRESWGSKVGGAGAAGRIHIEGPYTGSMSNPPVE